MKEDNLETPCSEREDGQHCNCWYDGDTCCSCGSTNTMRKILCWHPDGCDEELYYFNGYFYCWRHGKLRGTSKWVDDHITFMSNTRYYWPHMVILISLLGLYLVLFACGSKEILEPPTNMSNDSYIQFQDMMENLDPNKQIEISREDAQARALLGCGQEWDEDTIDGILQIAYEGICDE